MPSTLGRLLEGALTAEKSKRVQQPILPLSPNRQHVWRINSKNHQGAVILTRSLGNNTIYVQFNISSDDDEDDEDDEDGDDGDGSEDGGEDGEDEDGEDNEVDNIDCSISITKNYKSLLLNCSASSQGFEPYRVRFIEDSNLVLHEPTAESEEQIKARDVGPDYFELSPQIQVEFKTYLEKFEINETLANFIISFAEYKKHEEAKRWYESVINFVES